MYASSNIVPYGQHTESTAIEHEMRLHIILGLYILTKIR